ncbi:PWWP domain-containing protein 2B [Sceloporus undulatus]|uniref:PWWP domain-containing protein 2B n=1 Tax=Sceloporus undulatus TaxID=8520 RepID=UPI001C4B4D18|nr:PWWP domain-containing protein 2B [Sceloporus undulatus]XP_042312642.1 PWWP domain-containing protein 2B [Sceloporus undulatus]XP_042312643.1 PWWP domain-containing protein 2B [Sceloporus undulatus]XP_042312644.1 PWWP domain-containing protein 2B [Sceloporus undulatus]XP_042312645.1 PWWP domain-containing protein 2B [Sceloporus undulatus]XP_042312646.1 PWWP domain-containing protein 2B [Sceloporus undulatus]
MEEEAKKPQVGSWLPVLVEQMVDDTLVVTLSCGERRFTGILLDCTKKSGLFCVPPSSLPKTDDPPTNACTNGKSEDGQTVQLETERRPWEEKPPKANGEEQVPPLLPPPPSGSVLPYPPYFEGAPFPPPLWLRNTYNQWVPQPPPRTIKRTKRRLSRNRDPGRLIMSTIRLRPRQVLCEKCKNTLNPEESNTGRQNVKTRRKLSIQGKEQKRHSESDFAEKRSKREKREEDKFSGELLHRTPVIKISYSTPQGKGEVVKIPSRIHGSGKPFCPQRLLQNGGEDQEETKELEQYRDTKCFIDKSSSGHLASIPKLKLTRPVNSSADVPPPKIRLKPHRLSEGDNVSIYKAELIDEMNVLSTSGESHAATAATFYTDESADRSLAEMSSGSSCEDEDFKRFPQNKDGHDNLAFLMNYHKRKADSSSLSVCSNDSLDESKSSSSEVTSPEMCDFLPGDEASVSSSSKDERKIVPPLTVRLHTQSVSKCVTEDGRTISIGDIVWGKIHGFPWWPARVLDINLGQKENGDPSWQEAKVSWFGSPTTSFLSLSKLAPFSEYFKLRFNRKKKGMYRKAISEAAKAVEHLTPEIRDLLTQFET